MASKTQLRLGQITGSFGDIEGGIVDNIAAQAGAANINALTLNSGSLVGVFSELASAVKRVHGGDTFAGALAGEFLQGITVADAAGITVGTNSNEFSITESSDDITIKTLVSDKDMIFNVNDGGSDTEVFRLDGDVSALKVASGKQIQFGDAGENISGDGTDLAVNSSNNINIVATNLLTIDAQGTDSGDGVKITLGADTADTVFKVVNNSDQDAFTINGAKNATIGGNLTIAGNLDVNGTTTTIDTANLTVEDSIIGLGVSGSDGSFTDVGDRGIVFAKGASASSLLPSFYWSGGDDIFQLGLTATSAASSSFTDPTQGNHSTLRLGAAEFASANDSIGVKQNGTLEISGSNGINIRGDGANIQIQTIGSGRDIVFKNDTTTLFTLDDGFAHEIVGSLTVNGNGSNPGALVLNDADDTNTVTLKAAGNVTSNYELILPAAIGAGTQVLRLNSGATALEFADISAAGSTSKQVLTLDADNTGIAADTAVSLNSGAATANVTYSGDNITDLSLASTQGKVLDVFVNGQLLTSGSNAQIIANPATADYEVASVSTLKFGFALEAFDVIQAIKRG